jgi:type III pantothenate kinase
LDQGNTRLKAALYASDMVLGSTVRRWAIEADCATEWASYVQQFGPFSGVAWLGSRPLFNAVTEWLRVQGTQVPFFQVISGIQLPFQLAYATPETLGPDRLAAAAAARVLVPDGPLLVLQFGTAFTTEVLDEQNRYLGGTIAPGLRMRFQALHEHTARLPSLSPDAALFGKAPVGNSTATAIGHGVQFGLLAEAWALVEYHRSRYGDALNVLATGGDLPLLENHLPTPIFAEPYLVLQGAAELFRLNQPK